jgi:hypothetical protein
LFDRSVREFDVPLLKVKQPSCRRRAKEAISRRTWGATGWTRGNNEDIDALPRSVRNTGRSDLLLGVSYEGTTKTTFAEGAGAATSVQ